MEEFTAAGVRLDDLVARGARLHPNRTAIRTPQTAVTFGELEIAVNRCAAALRDLAGPPGAVIALVASLDPAFAVAYYGIARAGHVIAMVNPLLREDGLRHVLSLAGARLAIVTPAIEERLTALRGEFPDLEQVLLTGAPELSAELAPGATATGDAWPRPAGGPDDLVCLQFTSGTSGPPKGIRLSHRNLTVNAAQIAHSHGLDASSITLNHLPNYHPMHLNSALQAGAEQVLCPAPESAVAIRTANTHRATHFYSLPVRLARLAQDPELARLRFSTVTGVFSGGSALPRSAAERLAEHFGIPVVQGYGLAETSPLTHGDDPADPGPGSVGRAVPGTECRIVDVETREPLAVGAKGEIQVRGPQVMLGYLGDERGYGDDGWFSTGDLGRLDESGRLTVIDRLKDVFKCDNWLVSPSDIEQVALRHPAVRECVVFDHPDEFSTAVAHAVVVLADPTVPVSRIAEFVNAQVPYYERLHRVLAVDAVPRSVTGKIQRRDLRPLTAHIPDLDG